MIAGKDYRIVDPDALDTPAMLLFRDVVDHNIQCACDLADGGQNLIPHVKTHKSEALTRRQIELGIDTFKCATLKEVEMVLQVGARKVILAYPQTQAGKVERFCDTAAAYPDAWLAAIVSSSVHINMLAASAAQRKQVLPVMLDLDAGMHRTGIGPGHEAAELYREIDRHPLLQASGFHWYDGQDNFSDPLQREATAKRRIEVLQAFRKQIESEGMPVPYVVAGGVYSFMYYARTKGMVGSPGSFIYWDASCQSDMPDMPFRWAALILNQVVDRHPGQQTITTDLGSKAICSDLPIAERARLLGHEEAELVLQNEEHGVFKMPDPLPDVGDYLLAVPGHIGPTTILYPGSHVVDAAGIVVDYWIHTARDRT